MNIPNCGIRPGDVVGRGGTSLLSRAIQCCQRRQFGPSLGAKISHMGVCASKMVPVFGVGGGVLAAVWKPRMGVWEADPKGVVWTSLRVWFGDVDEAKGDYAIVLRPVNDDGQDVSASIGALIAANAAMMQGNPYDYAAFARLANICTWWNCWRWYARLLRWLHRPTPGEQGCSEVAVRSLLIPGAKPLLRIPQAWIDDPDMVTPCEIVESRHWRAVTDRPSLGQPRDILRSQTPPPAAGKGAPRPGHD